ncbi:transposase [Pedobacter alpinus]|uniref:Transposase n=1 Tax=Pedobacter alpinus TaxID=1590643 RepID=A0ABW5TPI0_9SPHI
MDKFKNKYRIPSARLQSWNYGYHAAYFITICTQNRIHYFGEIAEYEMHLNELGKIVENEWLKTIELRPDMNLEMGNFVVMPNHFHAIIVFGNNKYNTECVDGGGDGITDASDGEYGGAMHCASTTQNRFGPQSKNLASIVRGFKSSVTTNARKLGIVDFSWQSRFHDHIIRNAQSFENIQNYIANNALNWGKDKFYKKLT